MQHGTHTAVSHKVVYIVEIIHKVRTDPLSTAEAAEQTKERLGFCFSLLFLNKMRG